jgi:hypothetical protein
VHVGPACPSTHSLWAIHHRRRSVSVSATNVLSQSERAIAHCGVTDYGEATVDEAIHHVGRRLGFRFATGSTSSFSLCTGLAGATTLPLFTLPRFWLCYCPLGSFPSKVRPFALKGQLPPTFLHFVEIQLAVRRRTSHRFLPLRFRLCLLRACPLSGRITLTCAPWGREARCGSIA